MDLLVALYLLLDVRLRVAGNRRSRQALDHLAPRKDHFAYRNSDESVRRMQNQKRGTTQNRQARRGFDDKRNKSSQGMRVTDAIARATKCAPEPRLGLDLLTTLA